MEKWKIEEKEILMETQSMKYGIHFDYAMQKNLEKRNSILFAENRILWQTSVHIFPIQFSIPL